jgi:hypothetical protein
VISPLSGRQSTLLADLCRTSAPRDGHIRGFYSGVAMDRNGPYLGPITLLAIGKRIGTGRVENTAGFKYSRRSHEEFDILTSRLWVGHSNTNRQIPISVESARSELHFDLS